MTELELDIQEGEFLKRKRVLDNIKARMDKAYIVDEKTGCWEWKKYKSKTGYGYINISGLPVGAHRASIEIYGKQTIPEGMHVLHQCDNPGCINPEHLRVGTHQENMYEAKIRKRMGGPKGEKQIFSKLTEKDVIAIRKDDRPAKVIAIDYGVSKDTIFKVKSRFTWKHVK